MNTIIIIVAIAVVAYIAFSRGKSKRSGGQGGSVDTSGKVNRPK